ncbi:hypothetical protein VX037_17345 [Gordonia sp. Z-3]|uniref:hypothetical protein n=1 Tax=Gordonia TaxID=2053 RepID=UPI002E2B801F|nr:hypothetical protein [Gordonia sp. Z-3]MED5802796.1 hypothetical protein [Gordonia sp. Z-3]
MSFWQANSGVFQQVSEHGEQSSSAGGGQIGSVITAWPAPARAVMRAATFTACPNRSPSRTTALP